MQDSKFPRAVKDTVFSVIDNLEKSLSGITSDGLLTGFADWDRLTRGLHKGELTVIAARPCMGRTTLALNLVENLSLPGRVSDPSASAGPSVAPGAIFSIQQSDEWLVQRLICSRAGIGFSHFKSSIMGRSNQAKFMKAAAEVADAPIWIDDSPSLPIEQFVAKVTELKSKHDIQYIVIDYLQKTQAPHLREIRQTARELDVAIIALAQVNRSADSHSGRPRMSDLRGSSAIDQEADVIGLISRNEYYPEEDKDLAPPPADATLMIVKNRNGATGDIPLVFDRDLLRFTGWVRKDGELNLQF